MTTFDHFAIRLPAHFSANVMLSSAGLLLAAVCALGMAAFTGLIPGKVGYQGVHEAAANLGADAGLLRVACGANCGVVERIRVMHRPRVEAAQGVGSHFGNAASVYAGNAEDYLANFERRYHLTIRMPDHSTRVAVMRSPPQYAVGDQVRVSESGLLVPAGYDI